MEHVGHLDNLRREIIEAARYLFDSQGFDATSVNDLLQHMGVTRPTFLTYFQSMDELLEVIWSE